MRFDDTQYHDPSRLDFVPRSQRRQFYRIVMAFGGSLAVLLLVGILDTVRGSAYAPMLSLFIIVVMSIYIMVLKQRDVDHVMNTEYLNMLFAQGVALGNSFYFFVRMDGTTAYISSGVRRLFPDAMGAEAEPIDRILEQGGVEMADRQRLMQAVATCKADRLVLPIPVDHQMKEFMLTIDPLPRPAGMLLIRGREFQQRTEPNSAA